MMAREIVLSRGLVAVVDDVDFEYLTGIGRWHASALSGNTYYARRSVWSEGRNRALAMHSALTGWPRVDHINGNGLDNRRANLRPCSQHGNSQNKTVLRRDNTSGFVGVGYRPESGRWRAYVRDVNRVQRWVGNFASAPEAALARDAWLRENNPSEFWTFNFPMPGERGINRERTSA